MQFENILKCHPNFLHLLHEEDIEQCDCISLINENTELMIFLAKCNNSTEYEVRIYKANPADTYAPHKADCNLKRYVANDEFASFFFDNFIFARTFISTIIENHHEYQYRPI